MKSFLVPSLSINDIREKIVGLGKEVPLIDGGIRPYVNFDNAATTPPFKSVLEKIAAFSEWYASVHRGTGFKSQLSTHVYERCREKIMRFVGAVGEEQVVIFTNNATCAINKVCQHIEFQTDEVVLVTVAEHHSNMLPWRVNCPVEYVDVFDANGNFSYQTLGEKIKTSRKKIRLVAITGASNVTGSMPPLREVSAIVHDYGAELLVDASQLIVSRPVEMLSSRDRERIDYLVFSAHKMYAPFGTGVIVGPRRTFLNGRPDSVGGGTVDLVTLEDVQWTDLPEREEAGTPNLLGVVALAEAIDVLRGIGWDFIVSHSRMMTKKMLEGLNSISGITVYGNSDPESSVDRVGNISFNARNLPHGLLAAILGHEWGIGVRNGCFCAQPYVTKLLGFDENAIRDYSALIRKGDRTSLPGMVRASLGIYNNEDEVTYFIDALRTIVEKGSRARYTVDFRTGQYVPEGGGCNFDGYFSV